MKPHRPRYLLALFGVFLSLGACEECQTNKDCGTGKLCVENECKKSDSTFDSDITPPDSGSSGPAFGPSGGGNSDAGADAGGDVDADADSDADPSVTIKIYTIRAAFNKDLADFQLAEVDFDDIDTSALDPAPFAADRYVNSHGVTITGTNGQFADDSFGFNLEYIPSSSPNMYAPGPLFTSLDPGGYETDVTFVASDEKAFVAGFGAIFIDPDFPGLGQSSIAVYDSGHSILARDDSISGDNAEQIFRGMIAFVDGQPSPVISRVHLMNGNEFPTRDISEGVTLDDFVFTEPLVP
jgi:hypothetical protein